MEASSEMTTRSRLLPSPSRWSKSTRLPVKLLRLPLPSPTPRPVLRSLPRVARQAGETQTHPFSADPIEKSFAAFPTVMYINQIRDILPHMFPFLLVDRVIEYEPGLTPVAIKNVTINDNFFPGHFPERPIMPGVLMVEIFGCIAFVHILTLGRDKLIARAVKFY